MAKTKEKQEQPQPLTFIISEEELQEKIDSYKQLCETGEIERMSIPHFCGFIGCTEQELVALVKRGLYEPGENANVYSKRSLMLQRFFAWVRGQMFSAPAWGGQMKGLAWSLAQQDFGDGAVYRDKVQDEQKDIKLQVCFGGEDKRARKASK